MQRVNPLNQTIAKWHKAQDFNQQQRFPIYVKDHKSLRGAAFCKLDNIKQDILIYSCHQLKGLTITYITHNAELAQRFEDECNKEKISTKKHTDHWMYAYTIHSADNKILTTFVNIIDRMESLLEFKDEILQITNFNFISEISELNNIIEDLISGKKELNANQLKWTIQTKDPLNEITKERFIYLLNAPTCPAFEIQFFWHDTDIDFQKRLIDVLKKNTKVIITNSFFDSLSPQNFTFNYTNNIVALYNYRNQLLRKYPDFEFIIKHICFKNKFYSPNVSSETTPASLKTLAAYSLFSNKKQIEKYSELINSLPPDLLILINQFDVIQSLENKIEYTKIQELALKMGYFVLQNKNSLTP